MNNISIKGKVFILILFVLNFSKLYSQKAFIQIVSEPDVLVYLDGNFKGKTNFEEEGLIIEDVNNGSHTLRFSKYGFNSYSERINIKQGEVFLYKVNAFVPKIKITQKGNEEEKNISLMTGELKIQSLPISINIKISELRLSKDKSEDEWLAEEIPIGLYNLTFYWKDKKLTKQIEIKENELIHLFVNFYNMQVENITKDLKDFHSEKIEVETDDVPVYTKNLEDIHSEKLEVMEDVPFAIIEDVPVYPGCKGDKAKLRECFQTNVTKHVNRYFNSNLTSDLGLSPGIKRIFVMFKIDKKGNITDVMARAPHKRLQEEAIRVVKLLPKMTPGKQRGRAVGVKYSLPFAFKVE